MTVQRDDIVAEARDWLNVPWRHQGRSRHGVDCVGLLVVVCQKFGISGYDYAGYVRAPEPGFLRHFTAGGGVRVPLDQAEPGDVLAFRDEIYPCHTGFMASQDGLPTVIHAYSLRRKVTEDRLEGLARERLIAAFRLPGIAP